MSDERISILADYLEQQVGDATLTDGRIKEKMGVSNGSFYRMKPKALQLMQERAKERQKVVEQVKTKEVVEAVKKGLKTKQERLLILQKQVDASIAELEAGKHPVTKKPLSVMDRVMLRRSIRDLQAEISKIEGDYAPTKVASTDSKGNDLVQNMTDEEIEAEIKKLGGK